MRANVIKAVHFRGHRWFDAPPRASADAHTSAREGVSMALRTICLPRQRSLPRVEPCEPRRLLAATYYVSPTGLDSNPGTAAAPWKTIAKINTRDLNAGDRVLFQGGKIFETPAPSSTHLVYDEIGRASRRER